MIVVMRERASDAQVDAVIARLIDLGVDVHRSSGTTRTVLGVVGAHKVDPALIGLLDGVHDVVRISEPYTRASRTSTPGDTVIPVGQVRVGGRDVIVMAGPGSAENDEQVMATAAAVARAGATVLRGGAFTPRRAAHGFNGLGEAGLQMLRRGADAHGLLLVSEVTDVNQLDLVARYADILEVGARHMPHMSLLRELGHSRTPVVLQRGSAATVDEWLLAAEHILSAGNPEVILCEGGLRSCEGGTRYAFDVSSIPLARTLTHLPIVANPSHAAGRRDRVAAMARAAVAAGADGLLIDVHPDPDHALSDAAQSMALEPFEQLMGELRLIASAIGRCIGPSQASPERASRGPA